MAPWQILGNAMRTLLAMASNATPYGSFVSFQWQYSMDTTIPLWLSQTWTVLLTCHAHQVKQEPFTEEDRDNKWKHPVLSSTLDGRLDAICLTGSSEKGIRSWNVCLQCPLLIHWVMILLTALPASLTRITYSLQVHELQTLALMNGRYLRNGFTLLPTLLIPSLNTPSVDVDENMSGRSTQTQKLRK